MSEERARAQAMKFRDIDSIMEVLDLAYTSGVRTFMCTTHDRVGEIVDIVREHPDRYGEFLFYPGMPYAHKYANSVTEVGMLETLRRFAPGGVVETVFKGARSALKKDADQMMRMLVDAEMKRFEGVRTPVIFIQNVVTDLLLGLHLFDMFRVFDDYIHDRYEAEAGFITMNMPMLLDALDSVGVDNPIVCCNYNKLGFRMSGGIEAYDHALATRRFRCIAMSVFASGAIPPAQAIEWICERREIVSIVFGASSGSNISRTVELIDKYSAGDGATSTI
jgi:hypothetical protein